MIDINDLERVLQKNVPHYHPVVAFNPAKEKSTTLDLSKSNPDFTPEVYNDFQLFSSFIEQQHKNTGAKYLTGGYRELREMYRRSELFDSFAEPRSLHLGIDIWVGSSRVDLQACKLEYSIVSPK